MCCMKCCNSIMKKLEEFGVSEELERFRQAKLKAKGEGGS